MKRITLCLLMVLLGVYTASARQITPDEAMSVASDFMSSSELKSSMATNSALRPMKAPGLDANASVSPFYIFNRGENEGFVIISGDDRAPKILGYSDKGSFNAENLPPQLKAMMESWTEQMKQLPESVSQHISWEKRATTRSGEGILMETAEWGQGYPYNVLCPVIDGEQAPAGCVATAMAIAMKYHNWPDYTRGGMQDDFNYPEFTFNFDHYTIDWDVLDDKTNPKFASEVGKLMYSTGVASQMMYGPYESSAEMWPLGHKMIELYTYAKGCQYIEKEKFSDEEWYRMLEAQLLEVGPVIYRGSGSVGHAFVIDGYDGDSLFHVNWGWDGLLNGYFTLDFSDVGGSNFSEYQGMIINIKPDKERKEYSKSFVPNCDVYISSTNGSEGLNFYSPDITPGEVTKFKLPTITLNGHVGYYAIGVVDENDNILQILDMSGHNNNPSRYCPYPGMTMEFPVVFPGLMPGQRYQAVSMEAALAEDGYSFATPRSEDPKDWKLILGGLVYPCHFYDHGNRSVVSEVRFHIDENMPIVFPNWMTQDREFTLYKLRGGDCPENILIPSKGVTMDIKCADKNGNQEELYSIGTVGDDGVIGLNISMYSDIFDVYIKYEYDGDTRKDKDILEDYIIVQDGLIYKIIENGVSLIGYDNIGSNVVIPESISYGGAHLPVLHVENDALLYAPIKSLTIKNSASLGVFAFGGIANIESISFEGGLPDASWYQPFMNTKVEKVYFDKVDQTILMNSIMNLNWNWSPGEFGNAYIYNDNIDFYISEVGNPNNWDEGFYTSNIYSNGISICLNNGWIEKAFNSYNIPGIGTGNIGSDPSINIRQMWDYAIDRKHNKIKIEPLIDEIKITSVIVNGNVITAGKNFVYEVPSTENMEVSVHYILNGNKEMSSVYSAEYNAGLPEISLSNEVESVVLSQETAQLRVNDSIALTASVLPEDATDKTLTWTSDNEAVVTVDAYGNVTAVALGTATITATCGSVSATCIVNVIATPVEAIVFSQENWNGEEGESFRIEATVLPEDATDKTLLWSSSDEAIATVDSEGNVSVLKEGACVITASAADGSGVSAECIIKSMAGVEGIFSAEDSFDVYGLNGVLLKKNADREGLKTLTPGIYLIRQGGEMKKLVIR